MAENDGILTLTGSEDDNDRREFTRVSACIPFSCRVIADMDACYLKSRTVSDPYLTDFSIMPNVEDQMYGEWLKLINAKLDEIIKMMTLQREGFSTLPFTKVNISGNGMSFSLPEPFVKGSTIEARVVLTTINTIALFLYGEVVTVEPMDKGYNIGFRFINMDDVVRNEIIRFVFEREREMIRERRGT